ncbi:MAG: BACON domain-containing protein [Pseudomonadota bacterium]
MVHRYVQGTRLRARTRLGMIGLIVFCFLAVSFVHSPDVHSASVTLAWDPNQEPDIAGYMLYYGASSGNYTNSVDVGNQTQYTLLIPDDGKTCFCAATAYNTAGLESDYSNEVILNDLAECTYSIAPAGQNLGASGGTGTINVTAGSGCAWSAQSSVPWFTITSGASSTGNGTVQYSVAPNTTGSTRTAVMTIAEKLFTVTQQGQAAYTVTIVAKALTGGTISPSGDVKADPGSNVTFTINPNTGYLISDVKVDNASVGPVSSYAFNGVSANHSIQASFTAQAAQYYTITTKAGTGGRVSPSGTLTVKSGRTKTVYIRPNYRYRIADVKVDGVSVGPVRYYTFRKITNNHTVEAAFVQK